MYLREVQSQPAKKRQLRQVKLFEIIDHHGPRHVMGINATWAHHRSMRRSASTQGLNSGNCGLMWTLLHKENRIRMIRTYPIIGL